MKPISNNMLEENFLEKRQYYRWSSTGHLNWVHGHLQKTGQHSFDRVPLPDKGKHVRRRGRKATGQGWSLIAGLPKERRTRGAGGQLIPGELT